jgi:menaquinone-dependent protoporphyrinogen IX oxidase
MIGWVKVYIVHDSQKGNGRQMAEKLASEFRSRGAEVLAGHRLELTPERVAADPPDLLVLGAAVRKFVTSPPVKKWISRLGVELKRHKAGIPHAAVFLTHLMPDSLVRNRVARLQSSLSATPGIGEVHSEWLSGQVAGMAGPFVDGALEAAGAFAAGLHERVQPRS